jgi:hypothetical protein
MIVKEATSSLLPTGVAVAGVDDFDSSQTRAGDRSCACSCCMKLALYVMRLAGKALHAHISFKSIQRSTIAKLRVSRWTSAVRIDLETCHDVSGTRDTQKDILISITCPVSTTVENHTEDRPGQPPWTTALWHWGGT